MTFLLCVILSVIIALILGCNQWWQFLIAVMLGVQLWVIVYLFKHGFTSPPGGSR